jgi:hypothetical protein
MSSLIIWLHFLVITTPNIFPVFTRLQQEIRAIFNCNLKAQSCENFPNSIYPYKSTVIFQLFTVLKRKLGIGKSKRKAWLGSAK